MRLKAIGGAVVAASAMSVLGVGVASAAVQSHLAGFRTYIAPSSAAVTFTVPTIDCSPVDPSGFQAVALGTELFRPAAPGMTNSTGMFVAAVCAGPTPPVYEAVAQINGTQQLPPLPIQAGDVVTTAASENASVTSLTISDNNDGGGTPQTFTGPGGTPLWAGVGAISANCTSALGACSPVPELTSPVSFTAATLNGKGLLAALGLRTNLTSQTGAVQLTASPMGSDRKSFTVTWASSCGTGTARC